MRFANVAFVTIDSAMLLYTYIALSAGAVSASSTVPGGSSGSLPIFHVGLENAPVLAQTDDVWRSTG